MHKDNNNDNNNDDNNDLDNNKINANLKKLIDEIREEDPNYISPLLTDKPQTTENVLYIKPKPSIDHMIPIQFDQLEKMETKPIEYIFHPCLPVQGIGFIYATTGLGKTLFTLELAYTIAQGGKFLKYSCPMPRKVLYIDGEMAFNQVHMRLMAISKRQGQLDFPENFSLLTPDKIFPFRMPKIDCPYGQTYYEELVEKYKYEVLVIDNLSMLTSFDENKAHEWLPIQDWILKMRAKGVSIIIVHHAGKEKSGYRGTSKMIDCADVAISLQPIDDEGLDDDRLLVKKFKVFYQKSRIFGGIDAVPFEVNLANDIWSYKSIDITNMDIVIEKYKCSMSQREIAREMGINQSTVSRLIEKAKKEGRLIK